MAATYWVDFLNRETGDKRLVSVYSADAKTLKRKDVNAAYRKAVGKAKDKLRKELTKAGVKVGRSLGYNCIDIRCVG